MESTKSRFDMDGVASSTDRSSDIRERINRIESLTGVASETRSVCGRTADHIYGSNAVELNSAREPKHKEPRADCALSDLDNALDYLESELNGALMQAQRLRHL